MQPFDPTLTPAAEKLTPIRSEVRNKILYYCQSLVGVGHLTCSLRIIEQLLTHADVDLVQGGRDPGLAIDNPGLRVLRLPTILIDSQSGELYAPEHKDGMEAVWRARGQCLSAFVHGPYQALVTEFFPFGRRRFKDEIRALMTSVRAHNPAVPLFCSVREVLVPSPRDAELRMARDVARDYHSVFVRGDPQVVRFDDTFSQIDLIRERIVYTGYVTGPVPPPADARKNCILVTQGGGDVGSELLLAVMAVAPQLPNYEFILVGGAQTATATLHQLRDGAQSNNVQIVPFLSDFRERLTHCALSISMGGDNTLTDVIVTRTPALAYPYQGNSEQEVRIAKLAAKDFLHALTPADLPPEPLLEKIQTALSADYPQTTLAVDGARVTSERIKAVMNASAQAFENCWPTR